MDLQSTPGAAACTSGRDDDAAVLTGTVKLDASYVLAPDTGSLFISKIVAAGGGDATSLDIFKGVSGIFDAKSANVLSHNGNALVNKPFDASALMGGVRGGQ